MKGIKKTDHLDTRELMAACAEQLGFDQRVVDTVGGYI